VNNCGQALEVVVAF